MPTGQIKRYAYLSGSIRRLAEKRRLARIAGLVRSAAAVAVQIWRELWGSSAAASAASIALERERHAAPAGQSVGPGAAAPELQREVSQGAFAQAAASARPERQRSAAEAAKAFSQAGATTYKRNTRITSTGARRVTSSGDVRIIDQY